MMVANARRPHLLETKHWFLCQFTILFHTLFRVALQVITPWRNLLNTVICDVLTVYFTFYVVLIWNISVVVLIVSSSTVAALWVHHNYFWSTRGVVSPNSIFFRSLAHIGSEVSSWAPIFVSSTYPDKDSLSFRWMYNHSQLFLSSLISWSGVASSLRSHTNPANVYACFRREPLGHRSCPIFLNDDHKGTISNLWNMPSPEA